MSDTKHETRGVVVGLGALAAVFTLQAVLPGQSGLACLYPVAVLGALWSVNRWPAIVIGLVATGGVLAPFVGGSGAAGGGLIGGAGLVVATWLAVAMVLRHRGATSAEADLLRRTFEALPAGLVVYDGADRMALCNPANKSLYPAVADRMVSGTTFEDMVRATAASDLYRTDQEIEDFVRERVARHRNPGLPHSQVLSDGRHLFIQEVRLDDGSTIVLRTDISELSQEPAARGLSGGPSPG